MAAAILTQQQNSLKRVGLARESDTARGVLEWTVKIHRDTRVFAVYHILLGWKTREFYYETDELPNPRPTRP